MDYADARILIPPTDQEIQACLQEPFSQSGAYSRHFTQSEDFFVRLSDPVRIPSVPIHHDVTSLEPTMEYRKSVRNVVRRLVERAPDIFEGTTYFFDPRDHLRLSFYRLYRAADQVYMYQLKIDMTFHPSRHRIVAPGSNDLSPEYETSSLLVEADFVPIRTIDSTEGGAKLLTVSQSVSDTWIGETGRGYFVQGIWLDRELTKFFSKLFLSENARLYPYFPFTCKYRAVCHSAAALSSEGRKRFLPVVHHGRAFINEHIHEIEDALRSEEFSDEMATFVDMKKKVPGQWRAAFESLSIRRYLNEQDMREYELIDAAV